MSDQEVIIRGKYEMLASIEAKILDALERLERIESERLSEVVDRLERIECRMGDGRWV